MALKPGLQLTVALSMVAAACANGKPAPAMHEVLPTATPTPQDVAAEVCHDTVEKLALPPAAENPCTDVLMWYVGELGHWPGPDQFPTGVSHGHAAATNAVQQWIRDGYVPPTNETEAVNALKERMRAARVEQGW